MLNPNRTVYAVAVAAALLTSAWLVRYSGPEPGPTELFTHQLSFGDIDVDYTCRTGAYPGGAELAAREAHMKFDQGVTMIYDEAAANLQRQFDQANETRSIPEVEAGFADADSKMELLSDAISQVFGCVPTMRSRES